MSSCQERFLYARLQTGRIMVWWCLSVRPCVRLSDSPSDSPSVRPTLRPGLRPPVFRTFLIHALTYWAEILHIILFYCTTDQVGVSSISVNFWWSYTPLDLRILKIHSFPHFFLTRFDILSWNLAFDFVVLYYRLSSSVVNFRKFL